MEHILSLSYGKDSLACLGAIEELGWPLDRIVHAEVWATDTIPADLPPMVEFKKKADAIIKARWGIEVEHICAMTTYEDCFYKVPKERKRENTDFEGKVRGFPFQKGAWCQRDLKVRPLEITQKKKKYEDCFYKRNSDKSKMRGQIWGFPIVHGNWCTSQLKTSALNKINRRTIAYLGIAADEPQRFGNLTETKLSPLVEAGWTEADCRKWCIENDLLSPIYSTSTRGGCWFCHNQSTEQLRLLRKNYPELWKLLLKWDLDSPVTFKANGHTVHDYDRRFELEDKDLLPHDRAFRWFMCDNVQTRLW